MAKSILHLILDQALNYIAANGTRLCVCNAQPLTYADAITNFMLCIKTIAPGDFTGPADDVSGRKITVNQQTGVPVTNGGTALFIALADSVNSALLLVTTCTSQVLTAGNTVTIPAFKDNIADPT